MGLSCIGDDEMFKNRKKGAFGAPFFFGLSNLIGFTKRMDHQSHRAIPRKFFVVLREIPSSPLFYH